MQAIPWRWGGMKDIEVCGSKSFHKQNLRQHVPHGVQKDLKPPSMTHRKGLGWNSEPTVATYLWRSRILLPEDVSAGHRSQPSLLLPKEERTEKVSEELCKAGLWSNVVLVGQLGDVFSISHFRGLILLHYQKKNIPLLNCKYLEGFA